jgi:hypothetical protein
MNCVTSISGLLGLALVALVLGMRHGIDADHLAAIDAMTRCNAQDALPWHAAPDCGSRSVTASSCWRWRSAWR